MFILKNLAGYGANVRLYGDVGVYWDWKGVTTRTVTPYHLIQLHAILYGLREAPEFRSSSHQVLLPVHHKKLFYRFSIIITKSSNYGLILLIFCQFPTKNNRWDIIL